MFAAGEAFRYAKTGNQTVMKNVAKLYDGCQLLLNLTRHWSPDVCEVGFVITNENPSMTIDIIGALFTLRI